MRLLRDFPLLAFALVFLSIVGLALAQQSVGLLLVAGTLAAISWYVTEGPRGRSLPKWVSNVLVIAVALSALVEFVQQAHEAHVIVGRFGLWLTLIKLYERRTARDHAHLLMLSFLLMLVACLQTRDLLFGVILLAYVLLGLYVLLLYQLYASYERAKAERLEAIRPNGGELPRTPPGWLPPIKPIIGQHLGRQFRSLVMVIGIAGFALGTATFVLFPRNLGEGPITGIAPQSAQQRVGYTDQVNLLESGRITDSRRSVMRVQMLDDDGAPIEYHEPLRLRGAALDRYEGNGRWRTTPASAIEVSASPDHFTNLGRSPLALRARSADPSADVGSAEPAGQHTLTQVVRPSSPDSPLFSLATTVAVSTDRPVRVQYNPHSQTLATRTASTLNYRVRVDPAPSDALLAQLVADRPVGVLPELGPLKDPQIAALSQRLLVEAELPAERPRFEDDPAGYWSWARNAATIFTRHLHSPDFRYTLDLGFALPTRGGTREDPIRYFLLERQHGHCEYFASALVAMLVNVDVEARLIAGYLAGDYDATAGQYRVLERNAHAWVEVRTGEHRWTAFDPTPPAAIRAIVETPPTMAERLHWIYDHFNAAWARTVVAFDSQTQQRLVDRWDGRWKERLDVALDVLREYLHIINQAFYFGPAGYVYMLFVGSILILAIVTLIKLVRRSSAVRRAAKLDYLRNSADGRRREFNRLLRDSAFYLDMLETLHRNGAGKPQWLPPLAFASELAHTHPAAAEIVYRLTELFYTARYGGRLLSPEEVRSARLGVAKLSSILRGEKQEGAAS